MLKGREDDEQIIIPDEEGNEEVFNVLCRFDVAETGKRYILLVPSEEDEEAEEQEVYAFRYEEDDETDAGGRQGIHLYLIEDDEEWEVVESTFQTLIDEGELDGSH